MSMTSTLHKTAVDADRPWRVTLRAPETGIGDVAARVAQVEEALVAFAPIVRPLALSLDRGLREVETGVFVADPAAELPIANFSAELSVFGARRKAVYGGAADETVGLVASPSSVRTWITKACAVRRPGGRVDLRRLETLATAARLYGDGLKVVGATRAPVVVPDGETRWVAGPIDAEGFGGWAPVKLGWDAELGGLELDVRVFWTRWSEIGTPERAAIDTAVMALEQAGWTSA